MTFMLVRNDLDPAHVTLRYTYGPVTIELREDTAYLANYAKELAEELAPAPGV